MFFAAWFLSRGALCRSGRCASSRHLRVASCRFGGQISKWELPALVIPSRLARSPLEHSKEVSPNHERTRGQRRGE